MVNEFRVTLCLIIGWISASVPMALPDDARKPTSPEIQRHAKWAKIEIAFQGPESSVRGEPNPFRIEVDVQFTSPTGRRIIVPAFYNGDGRGGSSGRIWMVRFSADETGRWQYRTVSSVKELDGRTGRFEVVDAAADAKGFWKWGRLEAAGTPKNSIRYLKFREGPFWLKAGCDDPENFLGKNKNFNTLEKRKAAIDFLSSRGINSMYMMTHNIGGDDNDVWPWLGTTASEARRNAGKESRFDIARLEEWRELFEYMQDKGVVPYLVLEDDSAWSGYDHRRYYREMIARFGYLPALLFNFNEEYNENYRLPEALQWMKVLEEIDPYNHPRGIHNVNQPDDRYVDSPFVDFTSIQTRVRDPLLHNRIAQEWLERCRRRGKRLLVVNFDEGRPEEDRKGWWSAYLGGGVWEMHVREPYDRPLSSWEPGWMQLGGARAFMESLPFWKMSPHNELVREGKAFCLAQPPKTYALYLPDGGPVTVELAEQATFRYSWWNPSNGRRGRFQNAGTTNGGLRQFRPPGPGDWALRIVAISNDD
ncbi:MAG: hypothetical protein KatS3mg105_1260 [Gemmatales bacterium]|nr:MAG: hypothetical protein KatS3mg105_1260 [Gemmatales bacterium]